MRRRTLFEKWWPADLHIIGKDITRFHAVFWPAMLMAARLPLPRQVFGHGFMTIERPADEQDARHDRRSDRGGRSRSASIRCGCISSRRSRLAATATSRGSDYDERYNVDLANNLGNLVSRVSAMAARYREGVVRPAARRQRSTRAARRAGRGRLPAERWTRFALHEGAAAAFRLIDGTNEFIAATAPWTLAKDPAIGRSPDAGAVRRGGSDPPRGGAAATDHADVEPRNPAARRRRERRLSFDRDGRWRTDGERMLAPGRPAVAAQGDRRL